MRRERPGETGSSIWEALGVDPGAPGGSWARLAEGEGGGGSAICDNTVEDGDMTLSRM